MRIEKLREAYDIEPVLVHFPLHPDTPQEGREMAEGLILEFDGVGRGQYEAVNERLGIDMSTGAGEWPDGLLYHAGGAKDW